jgi:enoyl-CoA hydratase/carnithine racemase
MSSEVVQVELSDGVAVITMNDVARRNSVTAQLSLEVARACAELALNSDARAVILASAAPAFSAGGDVDSLANPSGSLDTVYKGFAALAGLNVPTIAAVNGPAVGAGVNWALACDVIVAAESARFDPRFLDIGIHPGGGHLWRLRDRVGRQAAAALVLMGESLTGREAAEKGLAWTCVADAELMDECRRLAVRAAGRSGELVRRTKSTLNASAGITNLRDASDLEHVAQAWSMTRPAFKEGVAALQQKLAAKH